jgi:hypothetical protein
MADWAPICAVKEAIKVSASATGSVLCYSFLACSLSTIITEAATSADDQLYLNHGTNLTLTLELTSRYHIILLRAQNTCTIPSTRPDVFPSTFSSSASDPARFFDVGLDSPRASFALDYVFIVRALRTPVMWSCVKAICSRRRPAVLITTQLGYRDHT